MLLLTSTSDIIRLITGTATSTIEVHASYVDVSGATVTPGRLNGDTGEPIAFSQYTDKSAQVVGDFGVGGVVALEGSNNGADWSVLTDPQGNPLNFSTAKIEMVAEATAFVRPRGRWLHQPGLDPAFEGVTP